MDGNQDDAWEEIKKTSSPIKNRKKKVVEKPLAARPLIKKKPSEIPELKVGKRLPEPARGFPRKEKRRIDKNIHELPCFDLHGKTIEAAYGSLEEFIRKKIIAGEKIIMVITGKGRSEHSIAAYLPKWLAHSELSRFVISYDNAPREFGGSGAWILRLRVGR